MTLLVLLLGFAASLGATLALVPVARRLGLRAGLVDHPDGVRKAHRAAVPNVGGLAIVVAAGLGIAAMTLARYGMPDALAGTLVLPSPFVLLGAGIIAVAGFWDDLSDFLPRAKVEAQLAVTGLAFIGGARIDAFDAALGGGTLALLVSVALTGVWMVGMMNAVNLIDGMDGLAAGVVAIALAGLAAAFGVHGDVGSLVLAAAVGGALVGFLCFNAPPATVFMGDGGSLFLGYVLGAYALLGSAHPNAVVGLVAAAVAMGIPVLDTATSLIRRRLTGEPLFVPDRGHLHHRLLARMSERRALLTLYALGGVLALGAVVMAALPTGPALAVFAAGAVGVYAFLRHVGYLPGPAEALRALGRRQPTTADRPGAGGEPDGSQTDDGR